MTSKPKIECTYQLLSEDNLSWFPPLFESAFKKKISYSEVKRKYDHSFMNKPYLGLYALHEGRPVAFIGICYYWASCNGQMELASNFTDSMVHPDYQGLSVYIKLLAKMEVLAKDNGICFSLGFPNDNSFYPVVHKGLWNFKNRMMGYSIPVPTTAKYIWNKRLGLEKVFLQKLKKRLSRYIVDYTKEAFVESDDLPHIIHDELFFKYRQTDRHLLLRLDNGYAWVKLGKYMSVGFVTVENEIKFKLLIEELRQVAAIAGIKQVLFQFTKGSWHDQVLSKHVKGFESWPLLFTNQQSSFDLEKLQIQFCDVDSF